MSELDLVFTDRRIIVAYAGFKPEIIRSDMLYSLGKIEEKRMIEAVKLRTPQEILESHKKNREIPYDKIIGVKLRRSWDCCVLDIFYAHGKDRFRLQTSQESV